MRLTKISIDAFRAIKRAEIDFGPGLNVLYGQNDVGKSTIAAAIRGALLVPPNSSEAGSYASWFASENPKVELTFVDPDGHFWRVRKTFGISSSSSAELLHSKDSITFVQDCRARQVEERLRAMLAWGIPTPGGRGGPRGVPTSFLAKVLLAEQTETDAILGQSIADDPDDSGKLRLTKALSTLAQDPLFKDVLDIAQREVDQYFTAKGRRRSGQTSAFTAASDQVKALKIELETLNRQLEESLTIEEQVNSLREARSQALVRIDDANHDLAAVESRFRNTEARRAIAIRLEKERTALEEIDAQLTRFEELTAEVQTCREQAAQHETQLSKADEARQVADADVQAAEEAVRLATSEDSEGQREVRRAQLSEEVSNLKAKILAANRRKTELETAIKARDDAARAQDEVATAKSALEEAVNERETARGKVKASENDLELARAVVAFVRWRDASAKNEDAARSRDAAARAIRQAEEKDAEAEALEKRASIAEKKLSEQAANLPTAEQLPLLLQLERDIEKAEAALGGGISVSVRPSAAVAITTATDEQATQSEEISTQRTFEAERKLKLAIADLVDIDITAGSAEKRKAVEALRSRWQEEAVPHLHRAEVQTIGEAQDLVADLARERESLAELKREEERLRGEASNLREKAKIHEETAGTGAISPNEIEARKSAIGAHDLQAVEEYYRNVGEPSEAKASTAYDDLATEHRALKDECTSVEQSATMTEYKLIEERKRATELDALRDATLSSFDSTDVDALHVEITEVVRSLELQRSKTELQLQSIETEASTEVQDARTALANARKAQRAAIDTRKDVAAALDTSRADLNSKTGALSEMRTRIERLNRSAAELQVEKSEAELVVVPAQPPATVEDVESAKRAVELASRECEQAKEELNLKEGALSRVGGAVLHEEVERLQEALAIAEAREREMEVDAEAWRLLRDTLREVENEEGAHLGRALAGPVQARFEELTDGRYRDLRLDSELKVEALQAKETDTSGNEVLEALSVGTRDQLATLIRLTIADQIRSTIVLDDHLVHTDPTRLVWFRDVLQRTAVNTQVIVLTCRAADYLLHDEMPDDAAQGDFAGGTIRAIDVGRVLERYA